MTNKKKKAIRPTDKSKGKVKEPTKTTENEEIDAFDFGGFPSDVDLKKNLGCGG
ncbi:hypothetical protein [Roseivirga misakiensis]|uniref:hypothetical protein n=1 Tax=Roseivirga misakiensis TaxID=1563681 RepID=UPI00159EFFFF|nr:hypothetical protein [Roseivirga misakiensis]